MQKCVVRDQVVRGSVCESSLVTCRVSSLLRLIDHWSAMSGRKEEYSNSQMSWLGPCHMNFVSSGGVMAVGTCKPAVQTSHGLHELNYEIVWTYIVQVSSGDHVREQSARSRTIDVGQIRIEWESMTQARYIPSSTTRQVISSKFG